MDKIKVSDEVFESLDKICNESNDFRAGLDYFATRLKNSQASLWETINGEYPETKTWIAEFNPKTREITKLYEKDKA